jgi:hypothetical protein
MRRLEKNMSYLDLVELLKFFSKCKRQILPFTYNFKQKVCRNLILYGGFCYLSQKKDLGLKKCRKLCRSLFYWDTVDLCAKYKM